MQGMPTSLRREVRSCPWIMAHRIEHAPVRFCYPKTAGCYTGQMAFWTRQTVGKQEGQASRLEGCPTNLAATVERRIPDGTLWVNPAWAEHQDHLCFHPVKPGAESVAESARTRLPPGKEGSEE